MSLAWTKKLLAPDGMYGIVRTERKDTKGKVTTTTVYDPSLYDALRASKKSSRQKKLIAKVMRRG